MLMRLLPLTMEQGRDEHPSGSHVLAANLAVRSKNVTLRPACQDESFERKSCGGLRIAGAQVAEKRRNALTLSAGDYRRPGGANALKQCSVVEERLRFVARLLDGEAMADLCRECGISRTSASGAKNDRQKLNSSWPNSTPGTWWSPSGAIASPDRCTTCSPS